MIQRGDISFVNLTPVKGREQEGERPVLVVSSDAINGQPLVVTVVVGTKGANVTRNYPTNVRVPAKETGLRMETVFYAFQVRSLDHSRFPEARAGTMPPHRMADVEAALKLVLELP
jgi:mRNA interferase MazF